MNGAQRCRPEHDSGPIAVACPTTTTARASHTYIRNNPVPCRTRVARRERPTFHDDDDDDDCDRDEDDDRGLCPRGSGGVRRRYCTRCASGGAGCHGRMIARQFFHLFLFLFVISDSAY